MRADGEARVLSLIALDSKGRKFTNCTSVRPTYEVRGETFVVVNGDYDSTAASNKFALLRDYVADAKNFELLKLRQRFDEQRDVVF